MELAPHCDSLDGPVVNAATDALDSEDVERVLSFVYKEARPSCGMRLISPSKPALKVPRPRRWLIGSSSRPRFASTAPAKALPTPG